MYHVGWHDSYHRRLVYNYVLILTYYGYKSNCFLNTRCKKITILKLSELIIYIFYTK